jgi:Bifunctional DNA primase/polymerase, N-terminal/Primase C terminal 1 (PriCT-1)
MITTIEEGIKFWHDILGMNTIPADTRNKKPLEEWKRWQTEGTPDQLQLHWERNGKFANGINILLGKIHHSVGLKDYYLACIDLDNEAAIREFCNFNGKQLTLEELTKHGFLVEQHLDDKERAHIYIITKDPLKKKVSSIPISGKYDENIPKIEVKSDGTCLVSVTPSVHEKGCKYEFIGDHKKFIDDRVFHNKNTIERHIDNICKKYKIEYLTDDANANQNYNPVLRNKQPIPKGQRHPTLVSYANSLIARNYKTTNRNTIYDYFVVYNNNPDEVEEPLPESELKQIFNDSWNNITTKQTKQVQLERHNEKEEAEDKPTNYQQKYSDGQILAEAVIIDKDPCFLVSDNGVITPKKEMVDGDRTIKPFQLEMYINRPYKFESFSQVEQLVEETKSEKLDTLYRLIKSIWKKYIDADNFHLTICAADTIFTFFQDKIGLTHYLFFVGNTGSGKSNNLTIFHFLAYRNMTSTGLSYANIFQFLGSGDEGIGTICEDEADNIDEDHEKMKIYKDGYTTGRPTTKTDTTYGRKQFKYNNFCFKAFAAERLPDSMKGKGFNQRILEIPCVYGFPKYDISEVVNPAGDDEFQYLLDELLQARNKMLIYRLLHYHEKIPNIKVNLQNREKQLFKPVLRIFQNTDTLKELLPVIGDYISKKRQANANTFHAYLYDIVKNLIHIKNSYELEVADIWASTIGGRLEGSEIPNKPMSYESAEFGTISQKIVIQIMKDVFGARPPKHHGSSRKLIFDKEKFKKIGQIYELRLEVKVVDGEFTDGTDGTDGTLSGSIGLDKHMDKGAEQ